MIPASIIKNLKEAHSLGKTVVLVTGVFDLLHVEHKNFLRKAKQVGDVLVVGVESDVRVRKLKGKNRPINSQEVRVANIKELRLADEVFVLPEKFDSPEDHKELIGLIRPDFLAVSSSSPRIKEKKKIMRSKGGRVIVVHKHNPNVSTTQIIESERIGK